METFKNTCKQCEHPIKNKLTFCSPSCYWESMRGVQRKPDKLCRYCRKPLVGHQRRKGYSKYCNRQCYVNYRKKQFIIKKGYKKILIPDHPRADSKGYVFEHIVVLEHELGRPLKNGEVSHHIDKNKFNNHPDNLTVFENHSLHMKEGHISS